MTSHQIWSYYVTKVDNFQHFELSPSLHLLLGKVKEFRAFQFTTSEVIIRRNFKGGGTPPPPHTHTHTHTQSHTHTHINTHTHTESLQG